MPSPADTVMVAVRDDPLELVSAVIVSPCSVFVAESQSEFSESVYSQSELDLIPNSFLSDSVGVGERGMVFSETLT